MSTSPSKPSIIPSLDTIQASINTGKSFQGQLDHNVHIENPQEWPHLHVPFSLSRKKFKDLSTAEFVYGYLDILTSQTPANQSLMQQHLMSIIHLSSKYHWDAILSFHTAMLDRKSTASTLQSNRLPMKLPMASNNNTHSTATTSSRLPGV